MTFWPECGADKICISSLSNFPTLHDGLFHVCQIWWNKKYKDLEQRYRKVYMGLKLTEPLAAP